MANFKGEVVLWFEGVVLSTSILEVHYKEINNKNEIDKIIIPAKIIAKRDHDQQVMIANSGEYYMDKGMLILNGDVKLQHGGSVVKTARLIYYTTLKKIDNKKSGPVNFRD